MTEIEMIKSIWEHITIMNDEQGRQAIEITRLGTQMDFICKFFWIIATASIGSSIASIWSLILYKPKK